MLKDAEFIGKTKIDNHFMVSISDMFPVATEGRGYVSGEVYEIDDDMIIEIDFLEGYNPNKPNKSFYLRKIVSTEYGDCYMYYQNNIDGKKIYDWNIFKERLKYENQKQAVA